jgi:hypothetical protein
MACRSACSGGEAETAQLERIAQQIYGRARQVLEQDDLLLP